VPLIQATTASRVRPGDKFLRRFQVKERVGQYDDATLWRWEQQGIFPRRVKIGPNAVAWIEREIDEWQVSRVESAA
jgi:prophage regulatory protein